MTSGTTMSDRPGVKNNQTKSKAKAPVPAKPKEPNAPKNRSAVNVVATGADDMDAAIARTLTRPEIGAAAVIEAWAKDTHDVNALAAELAGQVQAVNAGQLGRAEGILISQAHTLDAIFVNLMRRAMNQTTMPHWDAYMRMGMKAQSQCRATLQALADLKNPPVFAKQANIANGPQQVNNGVPHAPPAPARAHEENGAEPNKLLEDTRSGSTYLDLGATPATARGHPALEAVGAILRAEDRRGQIHGEPQCLEGRDAADAASAKPSS